MSAHEKSRGGYEESVTVAADMFHALSHPLRLSICLELVGAECAVGQLCTALHQPQHSVSQQLALLRKSGLVVARKQSRQVYYSIANAQLASILNRVIQDLPVTDVPVPDNTAAPVKFAPGKAFEAGQFSLVYGRQSQAAPASDDR